MIEIQEQRPTGWMTHLIREEAIADVLRYEDKLEISIDKEWYKFRAADGDIDELLDFLRNALLMGTGAHKVFFFGKTAPDSTLAPDAKP